MTPQLIPAQPEDRSRIDNMMQLYTYDFSEWATIPLGGDGRFATPDLRNYWEEPARHPFLILVAGELAGFALVNGVVVEPAAQYNIGDFFVARRFRRKGVGKAVAHQLFTTFRGRWEVYQIAGNVAAMAFWRAAILEVAGDFDEVQVRIGRFDCTQQRFSTSLPEQPPGGSGE